MPAPSTPENEADRLRHLHEYNILDTLPEKDFDDITKIASQICQTPISLISLIDKDRQFFKSRHGLDVIETHRDFSFCAYAILHPDEVLTIPNALKDDRFSDNPASINSPHIIFYTGVPLVNPEGYPLGTLCVVDHEPRTLTEDQVDSLKALAGQVVAQLELRRNVQQLQEREKKLELMNEQLDQFAAIISHDLKSPLNNILALTKKLKQELVEEVAPDRIQMLDYMQESAEKLGHMITDVLAYSKATDGVSMHQEKFPLSEVMEEVVELLAPPQNISIDLPHNLPDITTSKVALQQIFINLFSNAIQYNDKPTGKIKVRFTERQLHYDFVVEDNGRGIPSHHQKIIFKAFQTFKKSKDDPAGTGLGLSTVSKLVHKLGGEVNVHSVVGEGTQFSFSIQKN